jgi:orotate phosphoribosyltransferase-like protein
MIRVSLLETRNKESHMATNTLDRFLASRNNGRAPVSHTKRRLDAAGHTAVGLHLRVKNYVIKKSVSILKPKINDFDTIVCSGISGLLIAPIVADKLKKDLVIVRKPRREESRYSHNDVEGVKPGRYIIVDDLISSGNTITRIIDTIQDNEKHLLEGHSTCVGIYVYIPQWSSNSFDHHCRLSHQSYSIPVYSEWHPNARLP